MSGTPVPERSAAYREIFRDRPTPLAFVDLDALDGNAASIARRSGSKSLRVASKSIRCRAVMERILASSPTFRGVMCYSGDEAVHLARNGFDDLLVAYPIVGREEIARVCDAVREGKTIALMLDCEEHVERYAGAAAARGATLPVCIDADMSSDFALLGGLHFGVRRSPVSAPERAVALAEAIAARPSLRFEGIMGYEAQIAGVPDRVPGRRFMNALVRRLKRSSVRELRERRAAIVGALRAKGFAPRIVNGGGTGSLETTREEECVTETTAGSGFYCPKLFDHYSNFAHRPAAGFALSVVRRPGPGLFVCHGGGYVASGPPGPDRVPSPWLPEGAKLLPMEMAGEVQTPFEYRGPERIEIGDPIVFRHAKAGELCEHFDRLLFVSKGEIVGEAPTYRGDGTCFLG